MTIDDKLIEESAKIFPDAIVNLFELDLTHLKGSLIKFTPNVDIVDGVATNVIFNEEIYIPLPIELSGFDKSTETPPSPKIRLSNINNVLGRLLITLDDFVGCKLTHKKTFKKYIGDVENPISFETEVFYISKKTELNANYIEFELVTKMELNDVKIPNRQMWKNYCTRQYEGREDANAPSTACPYTDKVYFDYNDNANYQDGTAIRVEDDACSKTPNGCKLRFGNGQELPGYFFPGMKRPGRDR